MTRRRCPPSISCSRCALGARCYFAEMAGPDRRASPEIDPPRPDVDDGTSLETCCGYSEGEGHGAPRRFIPSDEPEE